MMVTPVLAAAVHDDARDGRRPAVGRQQARMHVPYAHRVEIEHFLRQNLPVCAGDEQRPARLKEDGRIALQTFGLQHGEMPSASAACLTGGRRQNALSALRAVGLRQNGGDAERGMQLLKGKDGKVGRPPQR